MKYVQMQKMEKFYIRLSIKNQVKYYKRENYEKENIENNFFIAAISTGIAVNSIENHVPVLFHHRLSGI